jgi:hypothetical protein
MKDSILNILKRSINTPIEKTTNLDVFESVNFNNHKKSIFTLQALKKELLLFLPKTKTGSNCISLGQNCKTSWYLKQLGLKTESNPFDWIFSSPQIINHCISDEFATFLNKENIITYSGKGYMGHSAYHSQMFNHKNLMDDYSYYQRCTARFMSLLSSSENNLFVMSLINESEKRPDWANGFQYGYKMPVHQGANSLTPLLDQIRKRNYNSKFLIIDYKTEASSEINFFKVNDSVFHINFSALGSSNGVNFTNNYDDFLFKLLIFNIF